MQVGDVIEGKYEVRRLIGEGGMGAVYEAHHLRIGRRLAVKTLHPALAKDKQMVARFLREAQTAAAIGSEHIVDVLDAGETPEGTPFLVMEHLEGSDLGQVLFEAGRLELAQAIYLIDQVCLGVGAAHERGIVHRDLKPQNLFVTHRADGSDWIKVLDFGIAKFKDALTKEAPELTTSGQVLGTPFYMAPEQARGAREVDHRADIYATGVILYELLSGARPFEASNYNQLIVKVATEAPRPLRAVLPAASEELEAVISRATAREPDARYRSMAELSQALAPFSTRSLAPAAPRTVLSARGDRAPTPVDGPTLPGTQASPAAAGRSLPITRAGPAGEDDGRQRPLPPTLAGAAEPELPDTSPEVAHRSQGPGGRRLALAALGALIFAGIAGAWVLLGGEPTGGQAPAAVSRETPVAPIAPTEAGPEPPRPLPAVPSTRSPEAPPSQAQPPAEGLGPEPPRRPAKLALADRGFVDGKQGFGWGNRCYLHMQDKRYEAARAACYQGLEVAEAPNILGPLYFNLGLVSKAEGFTEEARWYYRKSLTLRPNPTVQQRLDEL